MNDIVIQSKYRSSDLTIRVVLVLLAAKCFHENRIIISFLFFFPSVNGKSDPSIVVLSISNSFIINMISHGS